MVRTLIAFALVPIVMTGCKQQEPVPTTETPVEAHVAPAPKAEAVQPGQKPAADPAEGATPTAQVHDVACGCSLEKVGKCGNMIKVKDDYIPLTGDIGLGEMEFCGKEGVQAEVAGEVKDGAFVATSFKLVEKK